MSTPPASGQLALFELPEVEQVPAIPAAAAAPPRTTAAGGTRGMARPVRQTEPLVGPKVVVPMKLMLRVDTRDAQRLAAELENHLPGPLARLELTNNRTVMASFREVQPTEGHPAPAWALRIHYHFLGAPGTVVAAVGALLRTSPAVRARARATLRGWWSERVANRPIESATERTSRTLILRPTGDVHDLSAIRDEVVAAYFPDLVVSITWGRCGQPRRRRGGSIRLGSWEQRRGVIRIHPVLDQTWVPRWVVETIVHHELAHAAAPPVKRPGAARRAVHHAEFRALEQSHPQHLDAQAWIARHLDRLLRARRSSSR